VGSSNEGSGVRSGVVRIQSSTVQKPRPSYRSRAEQSKSSRHELLLALQPKKESLSPKQASAASAFACMHSASELLSGSKQPCVTQFWDAVCCGTFGCSKESALGKLCYCLMRPTIICWRLCQNKRLSPAAKERESPFAQSMRSIIQPHSVTIAKPIDLASRSAAPLSPIRSSPLS
jgi:hypothetical protein